MLLNMSADANFITLFIDAFIARLNVLIIIVLTIVSYKFLLVSKKRNLYTDTYLHCCLPI